MIDLRYNKLTDMDKIAQLKALSKLQVICVEGNVLTKKIPKYEAAIEHMFGRSMNVDPMELKDFSIFPEMEHVCFPQELVGSQKK